MINGLSAIGVQVILDKSNAKTFAQIIMRGQGHTETEIAFRNTL